MAQLVRAPPCHGGGRGFESRWGRSVIRIWDHSSAGRASALQAEGHRFEPYWSHSLLQAGVAELADAQDLKSCCRNTVPVRFRSPALVKNERNVEKSMFLFFCFIIYCIIIPNLYTVRKSYEKENHCKFINSNNACKCTVCRLWRYDTK